MTAKIDDHDNDGDGGYDDGDSHNDYDSDINNAVTVNVGDYLV